MIITKHGKTRLVERVNKITNFDEAKRIAKIAKYAGKTIDNYKNFESFFTYLQNKRSRSNSCSIRIYKNYIYIWKGRQHALVTVYPIPDKYFKEIKKNKSTI